MRNILVLAVLLSMCQYTYAAVTYVIPLSGEELPIGNRLNWATQTELHSKIFIVERSSDGLSFEGIGMVEAKGNTSNRNDYSFIDIGINEEKAFYRLKELEITGNSSFSATVLVNKQNSNSFTVLAMSHTSAVKDFNIYVDSHLDTDVICTVEDMVFRRVRVFKTSLKKGYNQINYDLEGLKRGLYKISFGADEESETLLVHKIDPKDSLFDVNLDGF